MQEGFSVALVYFNVTAHELKIKWVVNEQDAIDILTTISFLHKQLDECFVVPQHII